MTKIYLIRHAEAEGNVYRRLQGQYNSQITPNGMAQIRALSKRFEDIPVDAVYASDLGRTCLTSSAVWKPKGLPLQKDPRFREISCGIWEDLPFGWLERFEPEKNYAFSHSPKTWGVEGSEPFEVYTSRFLEAMAQARDAHPGGTVCIFSHGMVMRGVLQRLFFPDASDLGHSENTAVSLLTWDGRAYGLEYYHDASHLPQELTTLGKQLWWRGGDSRDFNMWYRDSTPGDRAFLEELGLPGDAKARISHLTDKPTGAVVTEGGVLRYLALRKEHRGKGLSAQLLGEAVSLARREGYKTLTLGEAAPDEAAKALFRTYGFQKGVMSLYQKV